MNHLQAAKKILIENAVELYLDRRSELEFSDYTYHFMNLGGLLAQIDKMKTFGEVIAAVESGKFEQLGYFAQEEYALTEFVNAVHYVIYPNAIKI